jgi:hypothetical protein
MHGTEHKDKLPPVVERASSGCAGHGGDGIRGTELGARGKERTARQRRVIGYQFSDLRATRLPLQVITP